MSIVENKPLPAETAKVLREEGLITRPGKSPCRWECLGCRLARGLALWRVPPVELMVSESLSSTEDEEIVGESVL